MNESRTVTTTGQGVARVVPDAAVVRVAVTHRDEGVAEAFAGVDEAARRVIEVARDFTDQAKIASADLNVHPRHDNQGRPAGFEARHGLVIACANLAAAGALLAHLARHVGNALSVEGLSLEVTDRGPALREARAAAFGDARARAEHLAGLCDDSLGVVLAVTEGGGGGGGFREAFAVAKLADMAIEPGESQVTTSVTVTWALSASKD